MFETNLLELDVLDFRCTLTCNSVSIEDDVVRSLFSFFMFAKPVFLLFKRCVGGKLYALGKVSGEHGRNGLNWDLLRLLYIFFDIFDRNKATGYSYS